MGTDDPTGKKPSGLEEAATVPAFDPVVSAEIPPELDAGTRIDRFTVLEKLGEGGMGVVLAAHDPLLDRTVAIKLMRPQSSGTGKAGQARQRLLREAQAMAKLSHPNVLPVFDAAEIGDQVFIAMEFVDGSTLRNWVRAEKRTWREILDVYIRAGRGLAAAHEAGLIHRDFKPDNVLIDAKGRVRVTDFGLVAAVASAMADTGDRGGADPVATGSLDDSASALAMSLTTTGDVMGTPNYMAPEQHRGGSTDARTDQFGFCVALYEALYGERPFAGLTYRQVADRVMAGEISEPPPEADVPAWVRAILLRGLSTASADRYLSMEALLDALARDPAVVRRRRLKLAAIAAVIAGLAGSLVFVVARQRSRSTAVCAGAEKELAGVWDDRVKQAVEHAFMATGQPFAADTYARVARSLDDYTRAWVAMRTEACEATRVHGTQSDTMLDLRMDCLAQRLAGLRALTALFAKASDPEVLQRAVGAAEAAPTLDACANTRLLSTAVPPPEDPKLRARVTALRERLAEANAQRVAGRYQSGLEIADEVVAAARVIDHSPLLADALFLSGLLQYRSQDAKAAEATLREAAQQAARAKNDDLAAKTWLVLMMVLSTGQRRPDAAMEVRPFAEAALARAGDEPGARAGYLREVGNVLMYQGKAAEANEYHRRALALAEQIYPPGDYNLMSFYHDLGGSLLNLGNPSESLAQFERARAIETRTLGESHPMVAVTLSNIAIVHDRMGEIDQAIALQQRALEISEKVLGPEHVIVADMLGRVGDYLAEGGRGTEARPLFERAISILERAAGENDPRLVRAYSRLAEELGHEHDYDHSREAFTRALSVAERVYGGKHEKVAELLSEVGDALSASGKIDEARGYHERALDMEERLLGPDHDTIATSLITMGELLRAQGKYAEAKGFYERALAMRERLSGKDDASLAAPLNNLGELACTEKRFAAAIELCSRALALEEKAYGTDEPDLAYFLTCLGRAELGLGKAKRALPNLERALALRERAGGAPPLELASTRLNLARALWDSGGDRARAQELVRQARAAHEAAPFVPHYLRAELAAWQRSHR